jgi:hypothetical protein
VQAARVKKLLRLPVETWESPDPVLDEFERCDRRRHICTGTGLAPATSAPGLGSPPAHICAGTARYDLGTERTLQQYWDFAGVDARKVRCTAARWQGCAQLERHNDRHATHASHATHAWRSCMHHASCRAVVADPLRCLCSSRCFGRSRPTCVRRRRRRGCAFAAEVSLRRQAGAELG